MIEMNSSVTATVTLSSESVLTFGALQALGKMTLRQSDIEIRSIDLAFTGEDIAFETTEGRISLHAIRAESGRRTVRILCDTLVRGSRETARQICFQLVTRLIARDRIASIYWHPTRQTLKSAEFRWMALEDLPQRFARPRVDLVANTYGVPLA